jgi:hypothetical protein
VELQGVLIGFAQLALVLTGFVSVFVVFLTAAEEKTRVNTHHAVSMLMGSLITVVDALIPIILFNYGLKGEALWWWSSLGAVILGMTFFVTMASLTLQLTREQFKEAGHLHMGLSYFFGFLATLIGAWNIFIEPLAGNSLLSMTLVFLISVIGFITFSIQKILYW